MKNFKIVLCLLSIIIFQNTLAQKKVLDHPDFDIWNRLRSPKLSLEGNFVMYSIEKGEPEPLWMVRGVPAIEKGINQGYELLNKNKKTSLNK